MQLLGSNHRKKYHCCPLLDPRIAYPRNSPNPSNGLLKKDLKLKSLASPILSASDFCYHIGFLSVTIGKGEAREKLEFAMQGVNEKYSQLEEVEKTYVRKALIEERRHYCDFICCLRPVVVSNHDLYIQ